MGVQPITRFKKTLVTRLVEGGSETTIELSSMTDFRGNTISFSDIGGDTGFLTIDPGTEFEEVISFTGISGNTLTGVTRGLAFKGNSFTAVAANKKPHEPGAEVIMTDSHHWFAKYMVDNQTAQTIAGVKTFSSYPKIASYVAPTANEEFAPKKYADDLAIAGAPDATDAVKGIVEKATLAETKAGTVLGGTSATLFSNAAEIAGAIQDSSWVYAADSVGTDSYAITITPTPAAYAVGQRFTFKAGTANTGAATLAVNGQAATTIKKQNDQDLETGDIEANQIVEVVYDGTNFQLLTPIASLPTTALLSEMGTFFAATDALAAEMENLTDGGDASDSHNHASLYTNSYFIKAVTRAGNTASGTQNIAHSLGTTPARVSITAYVTDDSTEVSAASEGHWDGTNTECIWKWVGTITSDTGIDTTNGIVLREQDVGTQQTAVITADATNVILTWTKTGTPDWDDMVILVEAHKLK